MGQRIKLAKRKFSDKRNRLAETLEETRWLVGRYRPFYTGHDRDTGHDRAGAPYGWRLLSAGNAVRGYPEFPVHLYLSRQQGATTAMIAFPIGVYQKGVPDRRTFVAIWE